MTPRNYCARRSVRSTRWWSADNCLESCVLTGVCCFAPMTCYTGSTRSARHCRRSETAMSVKVRPYRRGGWEVDIRVRLTDGAEGRERKRAPASSRSAALRWGEARELRLCVHGAPTPKKEVPTLGEFW